MDDCLYNPYPCEASGGIAPAALAFDCDGVILDSARLKRSAFAALYDDEPEAIRRDVRAYLDRRGGQPREVKFRHIESQILRRPAGQQRINELCERFRILVEKHMAGAPMIPGTLEVLAQWQGKCPVVLLSATPQRELERTVEQRGLAHYFDEVIGAPPDKVTALGNLLVRWHLSATQTVMVGDSYNDYRAARSNGTTFIGVVAPGDAMPFPPDTPTVQDLHGLYPQLQTLFPLL